MIEEFFEMVELSIVRVWSPTRLAKMPPPPAFFVELPEIVDPTTEDSAGEDAASRFHGEVARDRAVLHCKRAILEMDAAAEFEVLPLTVELASVAELCPQWKCRLRC